MSDRGGLGPAVPVPDGVVWVEGVIVAVRQRRTGYGDGGAARMLVADDRGWRLWGPMPRRFQSFHFWEQGRYRQHVGAVRGDRVRFQALLRPAVDDPAFGTFLRPVRAVINPT